jgi:hypothetical protein
LIVRVKDFVPPIAMPPTSTSIFFPLNFAILLLLQS